MSPKNRTRVYCLTCKRLLTAKISTIRDHYKTEDHLNSIGLSIDDAPSEEELKRLFTLPDPLESGYERKLARAVLKIGGISVTIKIPFEKVERMITEFHGLDEEDTSILQYVKFGKTKTRLVIINAIAECHKLDLARKLTNQKFTISLDESTDISGSKNLAIDCQFFDEESNQICTRHWGLFEVFEKGKKATATADRLVEVVTQAFEDYNVPLNNIYAISADGCSTMVGDLIGMYLSICRFRKE